MSELTPLWPNGVKIPLIGLSGEPDSGKTLFGLTIDPGPGTIVWDFEKSAETFLSLNFKWVDMPGLMREQRPKGYKPADLFAVWYEQVKAIEPGQYRVGQIDPVSEIEAALADYVHDHPGEFGKTRSQFDNSLGIFWGCVKDFWKKVLVDLSARIECVVFTSHMRDVFSGNKPVIGKREPKGKETLMETAALYLQLSRAPNDKGKKPEAPDAEVIKSRLAQISVTADGKITTKPYLPPHIVGCTPGIIRQYILNPPDYSRLKTGELAKIDKMGEDEKLRLQAQITDNERASEELRLSRLQLTREAVEVAQQITLPPMTPSVNKAVPAVREGQLKMLRTLRDSLNISDENWLHALDKRKVAAAENLSETQADEIIANLQRVGDKLHGLPLVKA